MKVFKKTTIIFFLLILSYCLTLAAAYSIPDRFLSSHVDSSIKVFEKEGEYPAINSANETGTKLDNFTDKLMVKKSMKNHKLSLIENIMSINGYPRYWHGYQVFLRPLLAVMSLGSIRMIYASLLFLLIGIISHFLIKRTDIYLGIAFLLSLAVANVAVFFFSMQFSNILLLTLFALLLLLVKPKLFQEKSNTLLYFFSIGSLANFFDLLTTPLISWGLPIIVLFYINSKDISRQDTSLGKKLGLFLSTGFFWSIGYGLTWLSKWLISSVILKQNVVRDAFNRILFRTEGSDKYPLQRLTMLKENFALMYPKVVILLLATTCLVFLYLAYKNRTGHLPLQFVCMFLLIAMTPYIWYNVLANHSQIHRWFTYRTQIVTTFAILSGFACLIPPKKMSK
ncbi:hypothetical protein [Enterococcus sp. C50]|uniref:hypothetical protein n=1 Tax=Enterococcus sp. C50 TaxID=3231311 RepID=UPI0034A06027